MRGKCHKSLIDETGDLKQTRRQHLSLEINLQKKHFKNYVSVVTDKVGKLEK